MRWKPCAPARGPAGPADSQQQDPRLGRRGRGQAGLAEQAGQRRERRGPVSRPSAAAGGEEVGRGAAGLGGLAPSWLAQRLRSAMMMSSFDDSMVQ